MSTRRHRHWLALEALAEIELAARACDAAAAANRETQAWEEYRVELEKGIAYWNAARAITDRLANERPGGNDA